jgi:peptidoglycan/xylan/chitin deacetylase (PgdA/CDA1 family)
MPSCDNLPTAVSDVRPRTSAEEAAMTTRRIRMTLVAGAVLAASMAYPIAQQATPEPPSWTWPESRWRTAVARVRAGRPLRPASWPAGARVAVALSFDYDNETLSLRNGDTSPSRLSSGEYGSRAALPRLLDLLRRYGIDATFFIPGVSAKLYPDDVRRIAAAGHELGIHGWIHEWTADLARDVERMLMQRSLDTLEALGGRRPVGSRTGSWEYSENTVELLQELGLIYDSSLMADDQAYEILAGGRPTGIVQLPVEWILDDFPYFGMDRFSSTRPYTPPSDVLEIWTEEFEGAYEEGGLFLLTMHPHIIGHRSRLRMLERLIQHIREKPGVWFATHEDVARYVQEHGE